ECGKQGRRETDVSDTFLDSSWYFLRYPSTEFDDRPFDAKRTKAWLPVTSYIGGNEHAVLHLLYSRFITMALKDLGHLAFEEPYVKFRAHGLIVKDGAKMSKSRGNVVVPDEYLQKWGADTFRMYLMFLGPFQEGGDFRDTGIIGIRRFLDKVWACVHEAAGAGTRQLPPQVQRKLHRTIKKVSADTESLSYNTAIAAMMEYVNQVREAGPAATTRGAIQPLLILLAPYAPHLAEALWERLGHKDSIFSQRWPSFDDRLTTATPNPTTSMARPELITPRPVKKLRAAPTAKCDTIATRNATMIAVSPLNARNGPTGMNAPTAVATPVTHPSLSGVDRACAI